MSKRMEISRVQFSSLYAQHEAAKAGRVWGCAVHVYRDERGTVRQTYSHKDHGIPTVESAPHEARFYQFVD